MARERPRRSVRRIPLVRHFPERELSACVPGEHGLFRRPECQGGGGEPAEPLGLAVAGANVYAVTYGAAPWSAPSSLVRLALAACAAAWLVWVLRGAGQNVGIVTLVTVGGDTLHWRKQNLWGHREFFWPASTIKAIRVRAAPLVEPSLIVERRDGHALNAFAFHAVDELHEAAAALTSALPGAGPAAGETSA